MCWVSGSRVGCGVGWGLYSILFQKVQETTKLPQKPKPLIFKGLVVFIVVFVVVYRCIEKRGSCLQKSCQLTDWSVGGWGSCLECLFVANHKTTKKSLKCLIFNGLMFCGSFVVAENSLTFNALQTSSKCLSLNAFAVLGGSRVGC